MTEETRWMSVKEAAKYTNMSQSTIRRWAARGWIKKYEVGTVARYDKKEIDELFLSGMKTGS